MTARLLLLVALTSGASAQPLSWDKLPPMAPKKISADVKFAGRELEAIEAARSQFRHDHFSTSGDLRHFEIELWREPGKLFVSFFPKYHEPSQRGGPASNKYGTYITYAVSLRTLKVIGYTFERD